MENIEDFVSGDGDLDYQTQHFIRAHSKDNNKSDIQTEVWNCAFEPDLRNPGKFTDLLATCGGNSVCLTNVRTAALKYKFNADVTERFFTLAWGLNLEHSANHLLAVGGNSRRVFFVSPSDRSVQVSQDLCSSRKGKLNSAINSLIFHPTQLDIFFCGLLDKENQVLIVQFSPSTLSQVKVLKRLFCPSDVVQLTFQHSSSLLLCGHNDGLHAWRLDTNLDRLDSERCEGLNVILPATPVVVDLKKKQAIQPDTMVDTVLALAGTSLVACKTLKSGHITIFDTKDLQTKNGQLKIGSHRFLKWATSFDPYLSLGWEPEKKILALGDDMGNIWLYNLADFDVASKDKSVVAPNNVLLWPKKVKDPHVEKERKLRIGTYDILVSQVALNGVHLAAVTRTNLICVWKMNEDL